MCVDYVLHSLSYSHESGVLKEEFFICIINFSAYSVEIWYHNDTIIGSPPFNLTLPGCTYTCPLDQFIKLTKDVIPVDILKECGVKGEDHGRNLSLSKYTCIRVAILGGYRRHWKIMEIEYTTGNTEKSIFAT